MTPACGTLTRTATPPPTYRNQAYVGGPRDGESSRLVSGEPPAVLVVDDSGGRYVLRDGSYQWNAS